MGILADLKKEASFLFQRNLNFHWGLSWGSVEVGGLHWFNACIVLRSPFLHLFISSSPSVCFNLSQFRNKINTIEHNIIF